MAKAQTQPQSQQDFIDQVSVEREPTLLDRMLETVGSVDEAQAYVPPGFVEAFVEAQTDLEAATQLFGKNFVRQTTLLEYKRQLSGLVCRVEQLLQEQVQQILHQPEFQRLEASWRGLWYLVDQTVRSLHTDRATRSTQVRIEVLDVKAEELRKDLTRALEFDQSQFFQKVYQEGFGVAGGEPFGLLIGDYEFGPHPRDCELLTQIAHVAEAAFAPFVAAASPELMGLETFAQLDRPFDLATTFLQPEFTKWRNFRKRKDAKFVSLIAPRVVYRKPYADDGKSLFGFRFDEDVSGRISADGSTADVGRFLWGNPCYAFGAVVVRSYCRSGWFADIRGQQMGQVGGGMIEGLPQIEFDTESPGMALRPQTEIILSRYWEDELVRNGIIPVTDCQDSPYSMFPANPSTYQHSANVRDPVAAENYRLSAMTQYVLCASRFAHYLKILARNKIGSMSSPQKLEEDLNGRWLQRYVSSALQLETEQRAKYPLREGRVAVERVPGRPGAYDLKIYLQPQFQLDDVSVGIDLTSELQS